MLRRFQRPGGEGRPIARRLVFACLSAASMAAVGGCGSGKPAPSTKGIVNAVGAESQYGNVIGQIGGRYVHVSSILNNPNTDPHTFESSPGVAREIGAAQLIVQNGVGYDTFMDKIESASPDTARKVITVQSLLGLPASTANPHLWYSPSTMPKVAATVAQALSALLPSHSAYFQANLKSFDNSLSPLFGAISAFRAKYGGVDVVTTEPVADYLLNALGVHNLTPFTFQADIMNGIDPPPQDISVVNGYLANHKARVLCYNQQVVDPLTASIRLAARQAGIPVVGVYETMPTPGFDYQTWMIDEVLAIQNAVEHGLSTEHL